MENTIEKNSAVHAMVVFRKASRAIDYYVGKSIREASLTMPQFSVLDVLYNKGDLTVNELMDNVLATAGNMTVILKNMGRDNYIERHVSEEDKRKSIIRITDKGKRTYEAILPNHVKEIEEVFNIYSEDERAELIRLLKYLKTREQKA